jgi:hypothetical protein
VPKYLLNMCQILCGISLVAFQCLNDRKLGEGGCLLSPPRFVCIMNIWIQICTLARCRLSVVSFVGSVGLVEFVGFVDLPVSLVFTPVFCEIENSCGSSCEGVNKESKR